MGVDYFSCENCRRVATEYDEIHCEKCESSLCSCAMPDEIAQLCQGWDDIFAYISERYVAETNETVIIKQSDEVSDETLEIFKKYLTFNDDYGIVLKEEYCPICQKRKENEKDFEYKEYLRLKAKFES